MDLQDGGKAPKKTAKLTKRYVESMTPESNRYIVWDSELKGFGVVVWPSGAKAYFVNYRTKDNTQRRYTIGKHNPTTTDQARKQASKLLSQVIDGDDPLSERREARSSATMEEFSGRFLEQYARPYKKASTVEGYELILKTILKPAFGSRKLTSIAKADVHRLHASMHDRPIMANRTLALLSVMLNLAREWGYLPSGSTNPCHGIKKYPEKGRDRFMSEGEFLALWKALDQMEEGRLVSQPAIDAIRLIVLTGCRRNEILSLKWDHVDLKAGCLNLPDSKTGAKRVLLNELAVDVFRSIERHESGWVIPGKVKDSHMREIKRAWAKVCELAAIKDYHVHDLRHSFASVGVGLGLALPIIGKLLGHSTTRMTERYAHLADSPLRSANDSIGVALREALGIPESSDEIEYFI